MLIYRITHPESDWIYIGKTKGTLKKRLSQHICDSKRHTYRICQWIKSLNSRPTIELIEDCDNSNWESREQYWIRFARQVMPDYVLNHLEGGGTGCTGIKWTEEQKDNLKKVRAEQRKLGTLGTPPIKYKSKEEKLKGHNVASRKNYHKNPQLNKDRLKLWRKNNPDKYKLQNKRNNDKRLGRI